MSTTEYLSIAATITVAYTVFGLTGFGAAMVAVPVLVQVVPLQFAVPLIVLLDLLATTLVGLRNGKLVSRKELLRLSPFLLLGVWIGATALARLDARWLLIGLGVFVIAMAARSLLSPAADQRVLHSGWVVPAGLAGGMFSALFGTGGPIYTMYLSRRLPDLETFRATIATVIFLSAIVRLAAFAGTGLLHQEGLVLTAASAVPFSLGGLALGASLRKKIAPATVKRLLLVFLTAGGCGVILRGLS
ncbi:sulfite exporter TauE/SafE family protein [Ramlibacter sp. Leaf400]|uniref:sulfite exporter TauE/SafE family protein n=1 Tax=Ramlibacter sp. Leaf400 TaxID=1736365 RepID=UPI0006FE2F2A|nr:sulfite exporter TauE/SafE family protein [Ramlibacter sp. Leaf400]KQT11304.1 hypothetical protein ASG30_05350 [Ramlibacter sp. Leaf400]